jgi:hypothetical protein
VIEILRTDDGTIKAVCEYYIVDNNGNFAPKGEYAWINECEIAPQFRGNGILKNFAKIIMEKNPQARFGYFWRQRKYPERTPRIYHKSRWLKLINGGN